MSETASLTPEILPFGPDGVVLRLGLSPDERVVATVPRLGYVVDAVCPLVTKVHHEVRTRAGKGYQIVYVGHEGHEEAVGTMAVAPDAIHRVESRSEVDALPSFETPVALLAQTTLSHRDWEDVLAATNERFPELWTPGRSDLCFATTNRQSALTALVERCDAIVVIGSANSSNTRALESLARDMGCEHVYRVNRADEIPTTISGVVGVTAGASAPEELVRDVIERLAPVDGVEEVRITEEEEYFPPPRKLRELLQSLDVAATLLMGRSLADRQAVNDRALKASDALSALS